MLFALKTEMKKLGLKFSLPVVALGVLLITGTSFGVWVFNEGSSATATVSNIIIKPFYLGGDGYYDDEGNNMNGKLDISDPNFNSDGTCTVTQINVKYNSTFENNTLTLPSVYYKNGVAYSVTCLGDGTKKSMSWTNASSLTTLVIPDSYTTINDMALATMASNIKTVSLGNSVKTIGKQAFTDCSSITSINFPASLETIGESAFARCSSLGSIDLSTATSLKSIGGGAFYQASLTGISFPNSLEEIDSFAFASNKLTEADLSKTKLTTLGTDNNSFGTGNVFNSELSGFTCYLPKTLSNCGKMTFNANSNANVYVQFAEADTPSGFVSTWYSDDSTAWSSSPSNNVTFHYSWDGVIK
jgi:hypothetical protein